MPTGSRDTDVLLDWILHSMSLVRRRPDHDEGLEQNGAMHRIMRDVILRDPLRGWDSNEIGEQTGLSNTQTRRLIQELRHLP